MNRTPPSKIISMPSLTQPFKRSLPSVMDNNQPPFKKRKLNDGEETRRQINEIPEKKHPLLNIKFTCSNRNPVIDMNQENSADSSMENNSHVTSESESISPEESSDESTDESIIDTTESPNNNSLILRINLRPSNEIKIIDDITQKKQLSQREQRIRGSGNLKKSVMALGRYFENKEQGLEAQLPYPFKLKPNNIQRRVFKQINEQRQRQEDKGMPIDYLAHISPGAGKTFMNLMLALMKKDEKTFIIVPHNQLISQTFERLKKYCSPELYSQIRNKIKVMKSDSVKGKKLTDQVCNNIINNHLIVLTTIQTLQHKERYKRINLSKIATAILDEGHEMLSDERVAVIQYLREKGIEIGVYTATPTSGFRGARSAYDLINHEGAPIINEDNNWLTPYPFQLACEEGALCPVVTKIIHIQSDVGRFSQEKNSSEGYHQDFNIKAVGEALNNNHIHNAIVDNILNGRDEYTNENGEKVLGRFYRDQKPIVFCSTIKEAKALAAAFNQVSKQQYLKTIDTNGNAGSMSSNFRIAAFVVSSDKDSNVNMNKANQRNIAAFKAGRVKVLINVGMLATGFDMPEVGCILILRQTRSKSLLEQMIGRGLRLLKNKYATILDVVCGDTDRRLAFELFSRGKDEAVFELGDVATCRKNQNVIEYAKVTVGNMARYKVIHNLDNNEPLLIHPVNRIKKRHLNPQLTKRKSPTRQAITENINDIKKAYVESFKALNEALKLIDEKLIVKLPDTFSTVDDDVVIVTGQAPINGNKSTVNNTSQRIIEPRDEGNNLVMTRQMTDRVEESTRILKDTRHKLSVERKKSNGRNVWPQDQNKQQARKQSTKTDKKLLQDLAKNQAAMANKIKQLLKQSIFRNFNFNTIDLDVEGDVLSAETLLRQKDALIRIAEEISQAVHTNEKSMQQVQEQQNQDEERQRQEQERQRQEKKQRQEQERQQRERSQREALKTVGENNIPLMSSASSLDEEMQKLINIVDSVHHERELKTPLSLPKTPEESRQIPNLISKHYDKDFCFKKLRRDQENQLVIISPCASEEVIRGLPQHITTVAVIGNNPAVLKFLPPHITRIEILSDTTIADKKRPLQQLVMYSNESDQIASFLKQIPKTVCVLGIGQRFSKYSYIPTQIKGLVYIGKVNRLECGIEQIPANIELVGFNAIETGYGAWKGCCSATAVRDLPSNVKAIVFLRRVYKSQITPIPDHVSIVVSNSLRYPLSGYSVVIRKMILEHPKNANKSYYYLYNGQLNLINHNQIIIKHTPILSNDITKVTPLSLTEEKIELIRIVDSVHHTSWDSESIATAMKFAGYATPAFLSSNYDRNFCFGLLKSRPEQKMVYLYGNSNPTDVSYLPAHITTVCVIDNDVNILKYLPKHIKRIEILNTYNLREFLQQLPKSIAVLGVDSYFSAFYEIPTHIKGLVYIGNVTAWSTELIPRHVTLVGFNAINMNKASTIYQDCCKESAVRELPTSVKAIVFINQVNQAQIKEIPRHVDLVVSHSHRHQMDGYHPGILRFISMDPDHKRKIYGSLNDGKLTFINGSQRPEINLFQTELLAPKRNVGTIGNNVEITPATYGHLNQQHNLSQPDSSLSPEMTIQTPGSTLQSFNRPPVNTITSSMPPGYQLQPRSPVLRTEAVNSGMPTLSGTSFHLRNMQNPGNFYPNPSVNNPHGFFTLPSNRDESVADSPELKFQFGKF